MVDLSMDVNIINQGDDSLRKPSCAPAIHRLQLRKPVED